MDPDVLASFDNDDLDGFLLFLGFSIQNDSHRSWCRIGLTVPLFEAMRLV